MEINEVWKDIVDFPNYQISNLGRVKSKERISNCCYNSKRKVKERILILSNNKKGYKTVCLFKNKKHNKTVHRLVAQAFIPNPNNYPIINHINGIKGNNRVENLEWCTHKYNTSESYRLGLQKPSDKQRNIVSEYCKNNRIKSTFQFDKKGNFIKEWESAVKIEKELGISRKSISQCVKGRSKSAGGFIWITKEQFEANAYTIEKER